MKKLLLVLAIGAFVACNDSTSTEETKTDSSVTTTTVDTNTVTTVDTTHVVDSSKMKSADTTIKK